MWRLPRIKIINSVAAATLMILGVPANAQTPANISDPAEAELVPLIAAFGFAVRAGLALYRRRRPVSVSFPKGLKEAPEPIRQNLPSPSVKLVRDGIDEDFSAWNLSGAERDVAWFMLRGLPLKEIANLRGTSERTVRQQAQSIYRKANLEGRSDLAGRVLERFI